jgi:hypothetical protein
LYVSPPAQLPLLPERVPFSGETLVRVTDPHVSVPIGGRRMSGRSTRM